MLHRGVGGRGRISKLQPFPADGKTGACNVASMDNDLLFTSPLYQMIAPFGKGRRRETRQGTVKKRGKSA